MASKSMVFAWVLAAAAGVAHAGDPANSPAVQAAAQTLAAPARLIDFTYKATLQPAASGSSTQGGVYLFLPIARDNAHQRVLSVNVDAPVDGRMLTEPQYGNRFWRARLDQLPDRPLTVTVHYRIVRAQFSRHGLMRHAAARYPGDYRGRFQQWLRPSSRVPTGGKLIRDELSDIDWSGDTPIAEARSIYNFVIDNMTYKKVGTGWGNGDTYWACSEKYGNCTDFHSLFLSLARAKGIPSRFEIGFPIPEDRPSGRIGGYHCWVTFWLPNVGWTPIDASEADQHPRMRKRYFGAWPANRVCFTSGRDLRLGKAQQGPDLNYFIYPYAEVDGRPYKRLSHDFAYRSWPLAHTQSATADGGRAARGAAS